MSKILIIEDDPDHFSRITDTIVKIDGYEYYPKIEEYDSFMKILMLKPFEVISDVLRKESPIAIVCDLRFYDDNTFGNKLINYIRESFILENNPSFGQFVPIIALTQFTDLGISAEMYGAIHATKYFDEHDYLDLIGESLFIEKLKHQIKLYKYKVNTASLLFPLFEHYKELLETNNKIIIEKIDTVEFIIQNNHTDTIKTLGVLFLISYEGLSSDKKQKFRDNYETEIRNLIGEEKFKLINTTKWKEFRDALTDLKSNGGVEKFSNCILDLLAEAQIFNFTGGKLLSIGLKGIIGVACS